MTTPSITLTVGLPGSGKSTWALEQVRKKGYKRLNRDSIREMLHGDCTPGRGMEDFITDAQFAMAGLLLAEGCRVIIDDTNLNPGVRKRWVEFARERKVPVNYRDFTDVDYSTCIKRDLARSRSVGERVIMDMWRRYIAPDPVEVDVSLPKCVIFDVDGTLALHVDRNPYEYEKCGTDAPNRNVVDVAKMLKGSHEIVVCSGREALPGVREATIEWLHRHGVTFSALFMRAEDDRRKDWIVKHEFLAKDILPKWNPVLVVDDRDQVVHMWRAVGLECWQVAPGDF